MSLSVNALAGFSIKHILLNRNLLNLQNYHKMSRIVFKFLNGEKDNAKHCICNAEWSKRNFFGKQPDHFKFEGNFMPEYLRMLLLNVSLVYVV